MMTVGNCVEWRLQRQQLQSKNIDEFVRKMFTLTTKSAAAMSAFWRRMIAQCTHQSGP
jgi:hypothetical protein